MDKKRIIVLLIIVFIFIVAITLSIFYYKGKYSVYFETGTNDVFLTKYVGKNKKINKPIEPTKEGYVFVEWQLNGEKYDFDTEIKKDTVLTAKWVKEEYITISFDTNTDEKIKSKKIIKGSKIDNLPQVYKEGYDFNGWYFNDSLYIDEELYKDTTLVANFKQVKKELKIGDLVKIVGNYSAKAYNPENIHSTAIGWERQIINILPDAENSYVGGYEDEVTGYFKEDSIEFISN